METLFFFLKKKVVSWGQQRTGKELTITKINSTERNKNQCANEATESLSCDHRGGSRDIIVHSAGTLYLQQNALRQIVILCLKHHSKFLCPKPFIYLFSISSACNVLITLFNLIATPTSTKGISWGLMTD